MTSDVLLLHAPVVRHRLAPRNRYGRPVHGFGQSTRHAHRAGTGKNKQAIVIQYPGPYFKDTYSYLGK